MNKVAFYIVIISLLIFGLDAFGQRKALKSGDIVELQANNEHLLFYEPFTFSQINEVPYFYDKKLIKKILKYRKKRKFDKLLSSMETYVSQFGIQNFYKDTQMLWSLGQLYEAHGKMEEAKYMYRYLLKHKRDSVQEVKKYYDSLTILEQDSYVPIQYYYDLVGTATSSDTIRPPDIYLNMGSEVNSEEADYGPTLNAAGDIMIFSTKRNKVKEFFALRDNEDLFITEKWSDAWVYAEPLTSINTTFNEGSPFLSRDGKTLLFVRCDCPTCYGDCDIFQATMRKDSTWGNATNLGANINGKTWDSQPSLSATGDTLFFASDRLGGFGLSDIFYAVKDEFGNWQRARNLGPKVNTNKNEVSPYYNPDDRILYFSSEGQIVNFGSFDIYKVRLYGQNRIGEPQNIGPLVNGPGSEYYFTIDAQSKYLYYARSEEDDIENLDLHSFELPMGAQPKAYTKFKGQLVDTANGGPMKGIVSIVDLNNGVSIAPKYLRPDGSFEFDLINSGTYLLIIQGEDFFRIEDVFTLDGNTERLFSTSPISSKLQFQSIEFFENDANIVPAMEDDIYKVVEFLLDHPQFKLTISGHTDSQGSNDVNLKLSQGRADAIRTYIIETGNLDPSRVQAIGYGSSKPIIEDERTDEDRHVNRRVEFEIYRD